MSGLPATVITGETFASPNDVAMHRTEPFKERFWVFKTYFNYKEKIGASKIRDNTKKYSKYDLQCLPAITWNKKIFLTQVAAITYTKAFCSYYLWKIRSHFLLDRGKSLAKLLDCITFLCISGEDRTK